MIKNTLTILLILFCYHLSGQSFNSIWDTEKPDGSASNQVVIPTNPSYTYSYAVNWGDGTSDTNVTGDITHTYASPGKYTIEISGDFPSIYFNNTGDKNKIIEILAWGTIQWQTMENAFYGCENLNFDAIDSPDLSKVTTLKNMFKNAKVFNGIVNNWDIITITDISGIFAGASTFNRPLDKWKTGNVTDMSETFMGATLYNEPLDNWNTALVTNMSSMFRSASDFNQNINNWTVTQVTDMSSMFASAKKFNSPLGDWIVNNVTNMSGMFQRATSFNQPLNDWIVNNVTNMSSMFDGYYWLMDFDQPLDKWKVSKVTNMSYMFRNCEQFNQNINGWDVSSVTNMQGMFNGAYVFNQPLDLWVVTAVTNMEEMFSYASAFNQPLESWIVTAVKSMEKMFYGTRDFNQPLNLWDVTSVTDMGGMFGSTTVFNQPLDNWKTGNVTNMYSMFSYTKAFNQDIGGWNVSNVRSMSSMFYNALAFNQPLNGWKTDSVISMNSMFGASDGTTVVFNQPLNNWNTSNVSTMSSMFINAGSFDQDLSSWNIAKVNRMHNMLSNSGLSQANYDKTLQGWVLQSVSSNVNLGATNLKYCDGRIARQKLIDDFKWKISGDIINCPFVICTSLVSPKNGEINAPANTNIVWKPVPGATGYRVDLKVVNGGITKTTYTDKDYGNVVGIDFTTDFTPGDEVFITVKPYNASGPAIGCTEESFKVVESWVNSPDAFKLTYDTSLPGITATNQLRIDASGRYPEYLKHNFSIDWGDDQFDHNVTNTITHTYLKPGIYTVSIIGTYPAHYSNAFSDRSKLLSIDQWGTQQWESMRQAFYYCSNMTYKATDVPDLSKLTNMSHMFSRASKFNGDINSWDVSNVTNMSGMFYSARSFNQPLDKWKVDNVTDMSSMFYGTTLFNSNIDSWVVSNVTNMSYMFGSTQVFNQPLSSWDLSSVTNMSGMFSDTKAFNQPLNGWKTTGNVTNMSSMFESAEVFNQPINDWDVKKVTDMHSMFRNTLQFNQPLDKWIVSSVTTMESMFNNAKVFDQNINSWNVTNVINMKEMFRYAEAFNKPLNKWEVNSVVNMSSMFENTKVFDQPLNDWIVSAVANMSSMFKNASQFNQPISIWDVSSVTLMNSMFENAQAFNQPINDWDVASVTNMAAMFKNAIVFDQPLDWKTGEVLTMAEMFSGASVFNQNINGWNVSFVRTMEAMFRNALAYNQPMNTWNVASVKTMRQMFNGATTFNQLIDKWNVRGVTTMSQMFDGATTFNKTINGWRVPGVSNMDYMFRNATAFNQSFDRWNIGTVSMRSMFENATSLDQEFSTWNVSQVSDMRNMLDNTALTRENYDTTLIAWSKQILTAGVGLGARGLPYCDALEERQSMIDNYGWSIVGDILDCPIPVCTQLSAPLNGDTNVPVNTNLSWEPTLYARGYRLTVRTNPGNITIVDNVIVTDTSYEFPTDFSGGETVSVTLIPFNDEGDATACTVESFEITSSVIPTVPDCTNLTMPANGAIDIAVDSNLEWLAIANADGYRITAGTASGASDIINNVDVGNVTTYNIPANLPEDTTIFVTIIPYNAIGDATSCTEESFTTEIIPVPPICTNLTSPLSGATNVPINTDLSWNPIANATGYLLTVGTTGGGIEILNNIDVGNVTTYDLLDDLRPNRLIFVTVIPYNDEGDATGCTEESFRTGSSPATAPSCTSLSSPLNNATDVAITTNLSWGAVAGATGYKLNVGTSSGGTDILNGHDAGNVTAHDLVTDLPESSTIYVTVIPYNVVGDAAGCTEESFTTETLPTAPTCTLLSSPLNNATDVAITTNLSWGTVTGATGYKLKVGTSSGGTDILNGYDAGNVTAHDLVTDLPESSTIYVTVIPYNVVGDAAGCTEESFTTETLPTVPTCTSLSSPLNNATDVAITTNLSWGAVAGATGYKLNVGTSSGGTDILNAHDAGNVTAHDLVTDLPENSAIYVTVIPYNVVGDAAGCTEESFTTETLPTAPTCTLLSSPLNNATDVAITTNLSWGTVTGATGYKLNVGTSSGGTDILNGHDAGNATVYDLVTDLPENSTIYVTVIPYNAVGDAAGCTEESFTTETLPTSPTCTSLSSPLNSAIDVAITTNLSWGAVAGATGYKLNVGTSSGGTDILNGHDAGNATVYDLVTDLPENSMIFVTVIPYNAVGDAAGCTEESFITETLSTAPACTTLSGPVNGATNVAVDTHLEWSAVTGATGYRISARTPGGVNNILNNVDVGNTTSYNLTTDLPENTTVHISIVPYNAVGDATGCSEESFTTGALLACTTLIHPLNNATDVAVDSNLSWNVVTGATGYRITIGALSGSSDILDNMDVGNLTTYDLPFDLPESTTLYIAVIPYNVSGDAIGCSLESFTTEALATIPNCTTLSSPLNGGANVAIDTDLSWNTVVGATGYKISVGTASGTHDIIDSQDVGNVSNLVLATDLPESTTIYITIIPYNMVGDANGCSEESFTTETLVDPLAESKYGISPNGDGINDFWEIKGIENSPQNTVNIYNRWGDMVFSISNYDNNSKVFRGEANALKQMGANTLPNGTYFFDIKISGGTHNLKKLKGFLVIKR
ncbi:BspA family leucine-rich repeat surface protein [Flavivirga eckloniae]|uniref:PKD domain-containing protein n=1 Tax=Flavivirga eckloniae TaxID=1803846 RepID=A0A2K9PRC7_9FLAO|nr:BspA family leucine-rich repeat surface protein [Flavivirga eckloniae]AUP79614.1 hypothetical protein C1H87_13210 [Flavivirga eckloniae]